MRYSPSTTARYPRLRLTAIFLLAAALVAVFAPNAAMANPSTELRSLIFSGEEIAESQVESPDPTDASIADHLRSNAVREIHTDMASLNEAELHAPGDDEAVAQVIWSDKTSFESLAIQGFDNETDASAGALGVIANENPDTAIDSDDGEVSFGYEPPMTVGGNLALRDSDCYTVIWTHGWGYQEDHKLNLCWYKYQDTTTSEWKYYRDADFTRGAPTASDVTNHTLDFTLRTRPWSGYESRVSSLEDYAPRDGNYTCNGGGDISIGIAGSHLTFPKPSECEDSIPIANFNEHQFGLAAEGEIERTYIRLSTAGEYSVVLPPVGPPVMADYSWVEVEACVIPVCVTPEYAEIDAGW